MSAESPEVTGGARVVVSRPRRAAPERCRSLRPLGGALQNVGYVCACAETSHGEMRICSDFRGVEIVMFTKVMSKSKRRPEMDHGRLREGIPPVNRIAVIH